MDDFGEVQLGVQPVQLAGGDERQEVGCSTGVVVGAAEEPCTTARGDTAQGTFGVIVGQGQSPVVEEATQRGLLPDRIAECRGD